MLLISTARTVIVLLLSGWLTFQRRPKGADLLPGIIPGHVLGTGLQTMMISHVAALLASSRF